MYIERVQVEEGFLGGMDVVLSPGLNVVIGARGTGKTSLIEMIRFCLEVPGSTNDVTRRSRDHALSILGSGQVTLTLQVDGQRIQVSRTAVDPLPRASGFFAKPIVFSQTEIETVGLEPIGRLRLVDSFIDAPPGDDTEQQRLVAEIASLTAESLKLGREIEDLDRSQLELPAVMEQLAQNQRLEESVSTTSAELQQKSATLQELSNRLSLAAVRQANLDRARGEISAWNHAIKGVAEYALSDDATAGSALHTFRDDIIRTRQQLNGALQMTYDVWLRLDQDEKAVAAERLQLEGTARSLRQDVDSLQAGAGQIMRRGQELRAKKAQLDSVAALVSARRQSLVALTKRRGDLLDKLEAIRTARFQARISVSQRLNGALRPGIRTSVMRNGQQNGFAAAIVELLRGSGLRYGELAQALAERLSPRALLEAIDEFDVDLLAEAGRISLDRASRVLSHFRTCNLSTLGAIDVEDEVSLQLLDGTDYKDVTALSTGQRCTVILPLILAHSDRTLVVDQPEDHIDNAFIAGTLIKSLLKRDPSSQILFSTHNPNIPVLGNADWVVHLGSDGRRGFVQAAGSLNEPAIVDAISNVMEGGADAFARRASFYDAFSLV